MSAPLDPSTVVPDRACLVETRTGSRLCLARQGSDRIAPAGGLVSPDVTDVTECNSDRNREESGQVRHYRYSG
jgi:hypothetical protein